MTSSSASGQVHQDPTLTPDDLETYIISEGISARLLRDVGDTSTVPLAAAALGVQAQQIIKSLLFLVRLPDRPAAPQPVLVIAGGRQRVDYRAIAAHFGVSRKRVRLASAKEVLDVLGYPAGGVPPFGHRNRVSAIVDAALLHLQPDNRAIVYGGGGDESTMLEITVAELLRIVQPKVLGVTAVEPTGQAAAD